MFSQVLPRCENADSACTVAARREWSAHAIASTDSSGTGLSRLGCAGPTITRFLRAIGLIRRHPSCSWAATCGPTAIFAIATPPARSSGCGLGTSPSEELSGGQQRYSCGRASRLRVQSTYIFFADIPNWPKDEPPAALPDRLPAWHPARLPCRHLQ